MGNITVTIEATNAQELNELIQGIAISSNPNLTVVPDVREELKNAEESVKVEKTKAPAKRTTQKKAPAKKEEVEVTEAEEVAVTPVVTLEQIRALAPEVAKTKGAEGRGAIKSLLAKYESTSISTLPKDKYDAFYAELEALNE